MLVHLVIDTRVDMAIVFAVSGVHFLQLGGLWVQFHH